MESNAYTPIENSDVDPRPVDAKSFLPDNTHSLIVDIIIALYLLVHSDQPELLENLHLVKTGNLVSTKQDYEKPVGLLQTYYRQYIAPSTSPEKSQEYGNLFTRLKHSVRQNNLFQQQALTQEEGIFNALNLNLSDTFSILEKVFSSEDLETILTSPKRSKEQKEIDKDNPTGTPEEEEDLIVFYYYPQILRARKRHSVESYQNKEEMFANLDKAIFEMMKLGREALAKNLLKHRMLLTNYFLNNKEKVLLVEELSHATGEVMNTFIAYPFDAKKINEAVDVYYADCVTSNAALSADSTGKRIIKSIAAIAVGLLFCALVLCVAWLISYYWAGIVLLDISWKIQAGIAVTAAFALTICGLFSFKKLRGEGYLDSEINQNTKKIAENMRQIARDIPT